MGAVPAGTVWNVRTDGNVLNGGGFVTGGTGTNSSLTTTPTAITSAANCPGAGNVVNTADAASTWVDQIANSVSGTGQTTTAGSSRFHVVSVVAGVSATFSTNASGASICTGAGASNGVIRVGGALAFNNSATDDALLENSVAGNKWYIKAGTYSIGSFSLSANGTQILPIQMIGYNLVHDDNPSIASGNQPILDSGASPPNFGTLWKHKYLQHTTTGTNGVQTGVSASVEHCKFSNTSGTAGRPAVTPNIDSRFVGCEFVSSAGVGMQTAATNARLTVIGSYFHDSDKGIRINVSSAAIKAVNNIFDTITTAGIEIAVANSDQNVIVGNTFYGASSPAGSSKGIDIITASQEYTILNNIFYGWVTGINSADAIQSCISDYNNFYNNTTNRTNWPTGTNDIALDPGFVDAPNGNFATGTNMQRVAFPSSFPGGLSTSYQDIGAIQANYASWFTDTGAANTLTSVGDYKYNSLSNNRTPTYVDVGAASNVKTGVSYGVGLTGSYTGSDRWSSPSVAACLTTQAWKEDSLTNNRTGTYTDVGAATNVKHDVAYGVGLTGSYRGYDLFDILGVSHVESGYSYLSDGSTLVGTLQNNSITNYVCRGSGNSRTTRATGVVR